MISLRYAPVFHEEQVVAGGGGTKGAGGTAAPPPPPATNTLNTWGTEHNTARNILGRNVQLLSPFILSHLHSEIRSARG